MRYQIPTRKSCKTVVMSYVFLTFSLTDDSSSLNKDLHYTLHPPSAGVKKNANEIQIPYDKRHKVSSLVKSHQLNTHNPVKYEVNENVKYPCQI